MIYIHEIFIYIPNYQDFPEQFPEMFQHTQQKTK